MKFCLNFPRRGLWIRKFIQQWLRNEHCRVEHCSVQQRFELWSMFSANVCKCAAVLPAGHYYSDGNKFLPSRGLVWSSKPSFWSLSAYFLAHCSIQSWHRSSCLQKSPLQKKRRNKIYNQRTLLLQFGSCDKCWRFRRCTLSVHKGFKNSVASNVKKLGPKLAE